MRNGIYCTHRKKGGRRYRLIIDTYKYVLYIHIAASPLASSGFAAIGCFRASPHAGIYILKNYSKLTSKKSANLEYV